MAKSNHQKNWLNVVIITVSGLILAFTLLGRFFDSGEHAALVNNQSPAQQFELIGIDFGQLQLAFSSGQWQAAPSGSFNQVQLEQLAKQWNLLLSMDNQIVSPIEALSVQSVSTVLLYFKGETRPIICKVVLAEKQAFVEFLASGQKVKVMPSFAQKLLPAKFELFKPRSENSQPIDEESDA